MMARGKRWIVAAMCVVMSAAASVAAAGPLQDDLAARRARLMERLGPNAIAVFWSAEPKVYSLDVDYEFHQDNQLYYLTGIAQEGAMLVLMPGNTTNKAILFVREPNPRREHWNGHLFTKEEATAESGIKTVYHVGEFESFLTSMFNRRPFGLRRGEVTDDYDAFFEAVAANRATLALPLGPRPTPSTPLPPVYEFAARARDRFVNVTVVDTFPLLADLRQIKTPYEQTLMEKSGVISSQAHMAGMSTAGPGRFEYQVEAAIEQVYLANGAMSWGYPSIVGSGPNATILHYGESSRQMQAGELLLVDAAANYQGYTVDITRTYPVSGTFTEAQKDLYRLVLAAQEAGMQAAKIGAKTSDVEKAAEAVVKPGLLKLGLITDVTGDQFRTWYTHGICHWIGMDVHDVGDYEKPLAAGMAFVVEPGIYVRPQALENLEDTPENRTFKGAVASAVEKYKGMGVRVEDSFLLTSTGLQRLSATTPRTVEEIERHLKTTRPTAAPAPR
ncbi:MAG: aminopeptidase P N-terminal domain-containing protein [Vicinamibacteraceae bacterium]